MTHALPLYSPALTPPYTTFIAITAYVCHTLEGGRDVERIFATELATGKRTSGINGRWRQK